LGKKLTKGRKRLRFEWEKDNLKKMELK